MKKKQIEFSKALLSRGKIGVKVCIDIIKWNLFLKKVIRVKLRTGKKLRANKIQLEVN